MYMKNLQELQGLFIDDRMAILRFVTVEPSATSLDEGKSKIGTARYPLPRDRNGFVAHMVDLVSPFDKSA